MLQHWLCTGMADKQSLLLALRKMEWQPGMVSFAWYCMWSVITIIMSSIHCSFFFQHYPWTQTHMHTCIYSWNIVEQCHRFYYLCTYLGCLIIHLYANLETDCLTYMSTSWYLLFSSIHTIFFPCKLLSSKTVKLQCTYIGMCMWCDSEKKTISYSMENLLFVFTHAVCMESILTH